MKKNLIIAIISFIASLCFLITFLIGGHIENLIIGILWLIACGLYLIILIKNRRK